MAAKCSFTFVLTPAQQEELTRLLGAGNYRPRQVEHARISVEAPECNITLYQSGKCLVQGRGAEEWVTFVLEPQVLKEARLGYEATLDPASVQPHMGVDESGKGDFFGPLVVAAAYVDEQLVAKLREMNVRDSKTITSDRKAEDMARAIRELLQPRYEVIVIGPAAYNRLYAKLHNVNRILAWGHARVIENLLEKVPACPRALSDQFGPARQIEQALMKKGRRIRLEQRPRAESDMAVAAASVLARAGFLDALRKLRERHRMVFPKGASEAVRAAATQLVGKAGPAALLETAKCHFRTTDLVLAELGLQRAALGPDGAAVSKPRREQRREDGPA